MWGQRGRVSKSIDIVKVGREVKWSLGSGEWGVK